MSRIQHTAVLIRSGLLLLLLLLLLLFVPPFVDSICFSFASFCFLSFNAGHNTSVCRACRIQYNGMANMYIPQYYCCMCVCTARLTVLSTFWHPAHNQFRADSCNPREMVLQLPHSGVVQFLSSRIYLQPVKKKSLFSTLPRTSLCPEKVRNWSPSPQNGSNVLSETCPEQPPASPAAHRSLPKSPSSLFRSNCCLRQLRL